MADEKDIIRSHVKEAGPKSTRRTKKERKAPDKTQTKEQAKAAELRRGKTTAWRLHPETGPAVQAMARKHGVSRRYLADFLIRAAMQMVAMGKIDLPLEKNETPGGQPNIIEPPAIPDEFRE